MPPQTETETPADTVTADLPHRFVGNPMYGPCLCGKPYASPEHHEPRGADHV